MDEQDEARTTSISVRVVRRDTGKLVVGEITNGGSADGAGQDDGIEIRARVGL